jgi:UDP-N-acetylglucosamine:LPS N-acetylglucosamine transferase
VERFVEQVTSLMADPARVSEMAAKARALAHPDAAAHIAEMALKAIRS